MSDYFGDIRLGDTLDIKFTTRQISGAPFTLGGTPVISAYPANSTTQLTAGITLSVDFDSVTGYNNVRVVASGGNGYLTATNYDLCITTGTVNSVSVVGESIGSFSIENRSALMPATAARTLVVDAAGLADANAVKLGPTGSGTALTARDIGLSVLLSSGTGTGQLSFTSGILKVDVDTIKTNPVVNGGTFTFPTNATGASTTNITAGTITTVTTVTTLTTYTGNTPQTGDNFARIGAAGAGLTALGDTRIANLDATISSRLASASYTAPPSAASVASAVLTTQMTESYATVHVVPTLAQAIFEVRGILAESSVAGTTLTTKKIDGATTGKTYTLSSATAPTSITNAS